MLPPVRHHLVRVCAVVVALQTMEMTAALLVCTWQVPTCVMQDVEFAVLALARDPAEPFELVPAQRVKSLVTGCVLYKSGLVAEPVVTILAHAVEVGLVLAVVAVRELAILVEPESHVALRNRFILEHPHAGLQPQLLLIHRHAGLVVVNMRPFLGTSKTTRPSRPGELLGWVKEVLLHPRVGWEPLEGVGHAPWQHHAGVGEERVHAGWEQAW